MKEMAMLYPHEELQTLNETVHEKMPDEEWELNDISCLAFGQEKTLSNIGCSCNLFSDYHFELFHINKTMLAKKPFSTFNHQTVQPSTHTQ